MIMVAALLGVLAAPALAACPPAPVAERLREPWWAGRHADILATIARHADPQVVLIGDSITHNYDKSTVPDENFQPTWRRFYAPRAALNLGFSGDTTAHVLWRLRHGEIDGIAPKVAIVLIGTNDTAQQRSAGQTVCAIVALVAEIERRLPKTRILLLGVLPSDISDAKSAADAAINASLAARYGTSPRVTYRDVSAVFRRNGRLDTTLYYDPRLRDRTARALHPDTIGQRRLAEAIEPVLARMLASSTRPRRQHR
jgi:lysophospholipase L1-like esterase